MCINTKAGHRSVRHYYSILANDEVTERAYFCAGGIGEARLDDKVIIEMCTMLPRRTQQLCRAVHSAGDEFFECPVVGPV